jgi:hypothetical protein
LQTATKTTIFVQGICSGVKKSPDNDFETHVQNDGVPIPVYFEPNSVNHCANAPEGAEQIDLSDFKHALEDAVGLDDEIDYRLSKVDYMYEVPGLGILWVDPAELLTCARTFRNFKINLEKRRTICGITSRNMRNCQSRKLTSLGCLFPEAFRSCAMSMAIPSQV